MQPSPDVPRPAPERAAPTDDAALQQALAARTRFRRLLHLASCESTQALAQQDTGAVTTTSTAPAADVYWADHQLAGRGRQGRSWHDEPAQDLAVTFRLRELSLPAPLHLAAAMPVAVLEALEAELGERLWLKWPNDVLLHGRKLAGILIDTAGGRPAPTYLLGVGVNVNRTRFPPELRGTAVSLALATGREHDRAALLLRLAEAIDRVLVELERGEPSRLQALFADRHGLLGKQVALRAADGERRGRLLALDFDGVVLEGHPRLPLGVVQALARA